MEQPVDILLLLKYYAAQPEYAARADFPRPRLVDNPLEMERRDVVEENGLVRRCELVNEIGRAYECAIYKREVILLAYVPYIYNYICHVTDK